MLAVTAVSGRTRGQVSRCDAPHDSSVICSIRSASSSAALTAVRSAATDAPVSEGAIAYGLSARAPAAETADDGFIPIAGCGGSGAYVALLQKSTMHRANIGAKQEHIDVDAVAILEIEALLLDTGDTG